MVESVGASFLDESDFQREIKWYILTILSQFEVCSTVSSDMSGISHFSEDIVPKTGSNSDNITLLEKNRVVDILYSGNSWLGKPVK